MADELFGIDAKQSKRLGQILTWWERYGKHLTPQAAEPHPPEAPVPCEIARARKPISSTIAASTAYSLYPSTATIPLQPFVEKRPQEKDGYGRMPSGGGKWYSPSPGIMAGALGHGLHPDTGSTIQARELTHGGASVFDRFLVFRHHQGGKRYALPIRAPLSIVGGELHTAGASKSTFLCWGAQLPGDVPDVNGPGSTNEWVAKGLGAELSLVTEPTTYEQGPTTPRQFTFGGAWSLVQDIWHRDCAFLSSTGLAADTSYRIFIYDSPTTWSTGGSTNWAPVPTWATSGWVSRFKLQAVPLTGAGSSNETLDYTRGAPVMKNEPRKRYIGAVHTSTDGLFENSEKARLVYNHYNPRYKQVRAEVPAGDLSLGSSIRTTKPIRVLRDGSASYGIHLHYHAEISQPASTVSSSDRRLSLSLDTWGSTNHLAYGAALGSTLPYRYPLNMSVSVNVCAPTTIAGAAVLVNSYSFSALASNYAGAELLRGQVHGLVEC